MKILIHMMPSKAKLGLMRPELRKPVCGFIKTGVPLDGPISCLLLLHRMCSRCSSRGLPEAAGQREALLGG